MGGILVWCKELTHWKRPWCWQRLKAGRGDDRGWDGWMAAPSQCTWVWASSGSWWWTGNPGKLQSMALQRVWLKDWTELIFLAEISLLKFFPLSIWIFLLFYNISFRILYFWYIFDRCMVYKYFLEVYNLFISSWTIYCRSKFCFNFY